MTRMPFPAAETAPAQVVITNYQFSPAVVHVKVGEPFVWLNQDDSLHNVQAADKRVCVQAVGHRRDISIHLQQAWDIRVPVQLSPPHDRHRRGAVSEAFMQQQLTNQTVVPCDSRPVRLSREDRGGARVAASPGRRASGQRGRGR